MIGYRLGLDVADHEIRAVLVARRNVRWSHRESIVGVDGLPEAVSRVIATMPRTRRRPHVQFGLSGARAQIKRLEGLPPLENEKLLNAVVRENTSAFFLARSRVVVPPLYMSSDGARFGAALDVSSVNTVMGEARRRGLLVDLVLPTTSALTHVVHDTVPPALRSLADDATPYVGAYAVANASRRTPLALRPRDAANTTSMRRMATAAAVLLVVVAGAMAVLAPGLRATRELRVARSMLARYGRLDSTATRVQDQLRAATQLLDTHARFETERGSIERLLGDITRALPDSTALVTLRADSAEVSFVATGPSVADLLPELGAVSQTEAARITGSVTRETLAGAKLERASFRLRRSRPRVATTKPRAAPAAGASR
ncbi:MAG TPA: hypothetical protein VN706_12790 [Gemmatimonadaceae bacterium]|nr:hypothetical protein [Gemmatimonadaceae bacterium]